MTHEDLKNVRRQRLRVISLQERIARLRSRAEFTAQQLGERGQDDATRDRLAEYVGELDDLERHLTSEMITLEHEVQAIDQELSQLPQNQEKVLRLRYCDGLKWRLVANKAGYCVSHCKDLNTKFIKEQTQPDVFL